jgi:thymidylate synthase ThyX
MPFAAKVIADSVSEAGARLTTVEIQCPLIIWAEVLTHRQLSRNAASNRAIPSKRIIEWVEEDPFEPIVWGRNCRGMQSWEELEGDDLQKARAVWRIHREQSLSAARNLAEAGLHKQWANRVLGTHQWIRAIISSTNWANFFSLRIDAPAQPEVRRIAELMYEAISLSEPTTRRPWQWHLPYTTAEERKELPTVLLAKISTARCARVSYLTHTGQRDIARDVDLHDQLLEDKHLSPFEHVASPSNGKEQVGNFAGWVQYRKQIPDEVYTDYKGMQ